MKLITAQEYANAQLQKYGLTDWQFKWKPGNNTLYGQCSYKRRTIYLQPRYTALRLEKEVFDTILHEIAHALVGPGFGHGPIWKMKAEEIGCNRAARALPTVLSEAEIVDPILVKLFKDKENAKRLSDKMLVSFHRKAIRKYLRELK